MSRQPCSYKTETPSSISTLINHSDHQTLHTQPTPASTTRPPLSPPPQHQSKPHRRHKKPTPEPPRQTVKQHQRGPPMSTATAVAELAVRETTSPIVYVSGMVYHVSTAININRALAIIHHASILLLGINRCVDKRACSVWRG